MLLFAASATAQIGSYLGPGVMSNGAGTIGDRSGQAVDLRFYADVSGVYDNGLNPFALDSNGNLLRVNGLYGIQLDLGAYGTHRWRRALLGLDYRGNIYHYNNASRYDGSTHNLTLGYTYQKSRRIVFDLREVAGTSSLGFASESYGVAAPTPTELVNQPTAELFDSRIYYLQSGADVNFIQSARTIYTLGGAGFLVRRQASGLAGLNGWNTHGTVEHRLSRRQTIGATYQRIHFEFPPAFGSSDINIGEGFLADEFTRRWTASISAGVAQSEIKGVEQVALDPVIAVLLGQSTGFRAFYRQAVFPTGQASLSAKFRKSIATLSYSQLIIPGNGVYLTSKQEAARLYYSYTGIRKWNLGASVSYENLDAIGQGLHPYSLFTGGAGFTYTLSRMFHIIGRYDARHQDINYLGYRQTGSRATLGLAFSPGDVPLSLW
ncbi:MAG: hypothetical protein ACRD30_10150 [Bryobacteraceae bacterium]